MLFYMNMELASLQVALAQDIQVCKTQKIIHETDNTNGWNGEKDATAYPYHT